MRMIKNFFNLSLPFGRSGYGVGSFLEFSWVWYLVLEPSYLTFFLKGVAKKTTIKFIRGG
jgi:hypothetical protein